MRPLHRADRASAFPDGINFARMWVTLCRTVTASSDVLVHSSVKVADVLNHAVELGLTFTLRLAVKTVIIGGPEAKVDASGSDSRASGLQRTFLPADGANRGGSCDISEPSSTSVRCSRRRSSAQTELTDERR